MLKVKIVVSLPSLKTPTQVDIEGEKESTFFEEMGSQKKDKIASSR